LFFALSLKSHHRNVGSSRAKFLNTYVYPAWAGPTVTTGMHIKNELMINLVNNSVSGSSSKKTFGNMLLKVKKDSITAGILNKIKRRFIFTRFQNLRKNSSKNKGIPFRLGASLGIPGPGLV